MDLRQSNYGYHISNYGDLITGIKNNQSQGSMNDLWGFIILLKMWSINGFMKLHNGLLDLHYGLIETHNSILKLYKSVALMEHHNS